jgi:hypothetical protein
VSDEPTDRRLVGRTEELLADVRAACSAAESEEMVCLLWEARKYLEFALARLRRVTGWGDARSEA